MMNVRAAQVSTPSVPVAPSVYRSLALNSVLQRLEPGRKYTILDLGQACGENIDFWSQFPVKICLPDFYRSLECSDAFASGDTIPGRSVLDDRIDWESAGPFDIILGWDLFNYFDRDQLKSLIRRLRKVCHPGTLVFILISTLSRIPAEPTNFKILDRERLLYDNSVSETKPGPKYHPRDVRLMMAGFEAFASFLLRHGFQEYLFIYQGS